MRFLVDECTGPSVARILAKLGHDVYSVFDSARGASDDDVIRKALDEQRILVTNDKDFGYKVFRENRQHCGVVLLRLRDEHRRNRVRTIQRLLETYATELGHNFVVVTETSVRFARPRS